MMGMGIVIIGWCCWWGTGMIVECDWWGNEGLSLWGDWEWYGDWVDREWGWCGVRVGGKNVQKKGDYRKIGVMGEMRMMWEWGWGENGVYGETVWGLDWGWLGNWSWFGGKWLMLKWGDRGMGLVWEVYEDWGKGMQENGDGREIGLMEEWGWWRVRVEGDEKWGWWGNGCALGIRKLGDLRIGVMGIGLMCDGNGVSVGGVGCRKKWGWWRIGVIGQ